MLNSNHGRSDSDSTKTHNISSLLTLCLCVEYFIIAYPFNPSYQCAINKILTFVRMIKGLSLRQCELKNLHASTAARLRLMNINRPI